MPSSCPTVATRRPFAQLVCALVIAIAGVLTPAGPVATAAFATTSPSGSVDPAEQSPTAAESDLVSMINADRAAAGLPALQVHPLLSAVARERSAAMAAAGQLSHVQPDGHTMVDLVTDSGITWYALGETIAWNSYPDLSDSTELVNRGWMNSAAHAVILLSKDYNYLGVGLALASNGDRYWTALLLRGPDRTPPWAKMLQPTPGDYATLASGRQVRRVTWSWTGADRQLAAFTSGLKSFDVQRRVDGGPWTSVRTGTTSRAWASSVWVGRRVEVRVRARDRAGNVGNWSAPVSFTG